MSDTTIDELSRAEIVGVLEREAHRRRGISAAELLASYRRGDLEEPGEVGDLLVLADLLAEDDPLFAAA